jgi:hypothetical protein
MGEESMADQQAPTPGEITIMAAGGFMLISSLLHFVGGSNAWGQGAFPIATLLPLYGLAMAVQIVVAKYAPIDLPAAVLGFTWEQLHLALGAMAALMGVGWLLTNTGGKEIGQWFLILGSIALVVGAVLLQRERQTGAIG